jgi:hypothetical protein
MLPVVEDPNEVGEPCTVADSGVSGIDDCVLGAMCWNVDAETMIGECVGFCTGSEANPTCTDPCTSCSINGDGVLLLCLPGCDPLAQDCSETQACYPINDGFACAPDAGEEEGEIGSPCEYLNVCDPGSWCADSQDVPGCAGAYGCCTPFCNVDATDECDALLPGTTCTPWFEDGQEPEACLGEGTIGACLATQ